MKNGIKAGMGERLGSAVARDAVVPADRYSHDLNNGAHRPGGRSRVVTPPITRERARCSQPGTFLTHLAVEFRYPRFMLNEKFVAAYSFPAGSSLRSKPPHAHHWVSDNRPGQCEFERWVCAWCGQKRIRLTAAGDPELVRDWLQPESVGAGTSR